MATVVTLLLVGAALLFLETILPGMIAGIIGFGCVVAAVIVAYVNFDQRTANFILLAVVVGLTVATLAWFKFFPESRFARLFISKHAVGDIGTEKPELLNQTGIALTTLRPSGTAVIDGKRVDVVTEGPFVDKGAAVKVVEVEGMRVVVRTV
ncbi:MAG TPA: NfeD family protein [Candidatus Angelobacter sp.]|nr:NfeD family protein [Candidatus Angelobacter sp.]